MGLACALQCGAKKAATLADCGNFLVEPMRFELTTSRVRF